MGFILSTYGHTHLGCFLLVFGSVTSASANQACKQNEAELFAAERLEESLGWRARQGCMQLFYAARGKPNPRYRFLSRCGCPPGKHAQ